MLNLRSDDGGEELADVAAGSMVENDFLRPAD